MLRTRGTNAEKYAHHPDTFQEEEIPNFNSRLRLVWKDILCIIVAAVALLALHQLPILFLQYRLMPYWIITDASGLRYLKVPTEYSYPYQKEILGDALCGVIVTLGPIAFLTLFQLFVGSAWDWYTACSGLIKAVLARYVLFLYGNVAHFD